MTVWILFMFLSISCRTNSNEPSGITHERQVKKTLPSTVIRTLKKEQRSKFGQVFEDFEGRSRLLKTPFLPQKRSLFTMGTGDESRKRIANIKENRKNGFRDLFGKRSSVKTKDFCKVDCNKNVYIKKMFPKPSEYKKHILEKAESKGALCLDGTPGVYFLRKSKYSSNKWIIFLPGGSWCSNKETCLARSRTYLGSNRYYPSLENDGGILSSNRSKNPHFYDWNVLYLQYCDGGSFLGELEKPIVYKNTSIYLRGFKILSNFLDEIIPKYLAKACEVVVVGNSASALGLMANADYISSRIPKQIKVHFVADGGVFIDVLCKNDERVLSRWMKELYGFHNTTSALLRDCVATFNKSEEWKCLMPEHFLRFTKSPLAIINSLSDAWQLVNFKGAQCGYVPHSCNDYELALAQQLHQTSQEVLKPIMNKTHFSFFLFSCIKHCTVTYDRSWRLLEIGSISIEDFVYGFISGEQKILIDNKLDSNEPACT